jgi:hypothetical protein
MTTPVWLTPEDRAEIAEIAAEMATINRTTPPTYWFAPELGDKDVEVLRVMLDSDARYCTPGFLCEIFDRDGECIAKRIPASWNEVGARGSYEC